MTWLRSLRFAAVCLTLVTTWSSPALAGEAFPWTGTEKLTTAKGQTLSWTAARTGAEVVITGTHPKWTVEHRARIDGTPLTTTRRTGQAG